MARTRQGELEFANFVCLFGRYELADLVEDVVIPAFQSGEKRKYGNSQYLIIDTELVDLGQDDAGLIFRLVKDTKLEREQYYDGSALIPNRRRLQSSPSALGLLVLNSHKLVYYPETQYAPSLSELRATAETVIRVQQKRYVETLVADRATSEDKKALRVQLNEKYPPCKLRIVPLSDEAEIALLMQRYAMVKKVTISFAAPNNDIEWDPFFERLQASRGELGAKTTKLEHSNSAGLNAEAAVREVAAATRNGNSDVAVIGVTAEGDTIKHENEGFRVRVNAEISAEFSHIAAREMVGAFRHLVEKGTIAKPQVADKALQVARRILRRLKSPKQ